MIAGCAFSVSFSSSSGPSHISRNRFWPSASSTSSNTSRAGRLAPASAAPMPTAWLPCPGKIKRASKPLLVSLGGAVRPSDARIAKPGSRRDASRRMAASWSIDTQLGSRSRMKLGIWMSAGAWSSASMIGSGIFLLPTTLAPLRLNSVIAGWVITASGHDVPGFCAGADWQRLHARRAFRICRTAFGAHRASCRLVFWIFASGSPECGDRDRSRYAASRLRAGLGGNRVVRRRSPHCVIDGL